MLLRRMELTVSEIVQVIGQSQPRVSQHLKILCAAGLLERFKEGNWVFYRAMDRGAGADFGAALQGLVAEHGDVDGADAKRLARIREARAAEAAAYFKRNAAEWGRIRALHAPDEEVETVIVRRLTGRPIETLLDSGTGTGRMLELLAPYVKRAVGVDTSPEMLTIARERLARANLQHCQVRLGSIYDLPLTGWDSAQSFDLILYHQVLHYIDDPLAAILAGARVMSQNSCVMVVDYAPHELEYLRTNFAHRRLGFADREVEGWFRAAGLQPLSTDVIPPPTSSKDKLTVKVWLAAPKGNRANS